MFALLSATFFDLKAQCFSDKYNNNFNFIVSGLENGNLFGSTDHFSFDLPSTGNFTVTLSVSGDKALTHSLNVHLDGFTGGANDGGEFPFFSNGTPIDLEVRGNVNEFPSWGCITLFYKIDIFSIIGSHVCTRTIQVTLQKETCVWKDDEVNRSANKPKDGFGLFHAGGEQTFYAANKTGGGIGLFNIYEEQSLYGFGFCYDINNSSPNLSSHGTDQLSPWVIFCG